jgi:hypothetical protein
MNARRVFAVVLLVLAFAGFASTRGALSPAHNLPTVVQVVIAAAAAACLLAGVALWVKGGKASD